MKMFARGIQLYLVGLAFIATLVIVWGTNGFVLENTATGTGWPLMIVLAGLFVLLGVLIRHRRAQSKPDSARDQYPWNSRK